MLRKILGKKSKHDTQVEIVNPQIVEKISKMNLSDMRIYVKNGFKDFEVCIDGLNEVMKRLTTHINDKGEYYIRHDDMDSKKKKAFELVLLVASSKRISIDSLTLIENFTKIYEEMIREYDKKYKDIYHSRFKKAIEAALVNIHTITHVHKKIDMLH